MSIVFNTGSMKYRENQSDTWHPLIIAANMSQDTILYFTDVECSATTGFFVSLYDDAITADHVLLECNFARPDYIDPNAVWITDNGVLTISGTCNYATTATIVLGKKNN